MTSPSDVVPVPESVRFASTVATPRQEEDAVSMSPYQEINERRARIENTELLQQLRGL
jgi:hypothetical protein